jgi:hypothetical protein
MFQVMGVNGALIRNVYGTLAPTVRPHHCLMPIADDSAYGPVTMIVSPDMDQIGRSSELTSLASIHNEEVLTGHLKCSVIFEHINGQGSRDDLPAQLRYVLCVTTLTKRRFQLISRVGREVIVLVEPTSSSRGYTI